MKELIRDTPFGQLVRLVTKNRFFKFTEEEDPSTWTRYIDEKKSGNLAHHGGHQCSRRWDEPLGAGWCSDEGGSVHFGTTAESFQCPPIDFVG